MFRAVVQRDAARAGQLADVLLATQVDLGIENREYLLIAGMTGHIAAGAPARAKTLWDHHSPRLSRAAYNQPLLRLLRCRAAPDGCAEAFEAQEGRGGS